VCIDLSRQRPCSHRFQPTLTGVMGRAYLLRGQQRCRFSMRLQFESFLPYCYAALCVLTPNRFSVVIAHTLALVARSLLGQIEIAVRCRGRFFDVRASN